MEALYACILFLFFTGVREEPLVLCRRGPVSEYVSRLSARGKYRISIPSSSSISVGRALHASPALSRCLPLSSLTSRVLFTSVFN